MMSQVQAAGISRTSQVKWVLYVIYPNWYW